MIPLDLVKLHLRIFINDEDQLLQSYIDSAIRYIERHCDRRIVFALQEGQELTDGEMLYEPDIEQAALQLIGFWYLNREAQAYGSVTQESMNIVDRLLWTRKRF